MEIELVEEEEISPLESSLDYLNKNIYTKMTKKDALEIKTKCLGGSLLNAINKYYRNKKAIDNEELIKNYEFQLRSKQETIERLRENGEERKVYRKRSDNYVGD